MTTTPPSPATLTDDTGAMARRWAIGQLASIHPQLAADRLQPLKRLTRKRVHLARAVA